MKRDHRLALFTLAALAGYALLLTLPYPLAAPAAVAPWLLNAQGTLQQPFWFFYLPLQQSVAAQTRALFVLMGLGFLSSYYLPPGQAKTATVAVTLLGLGWAFGAAVAAQFLVWVLAIFLCFHPVEPGHRHLLGGFALACLTGAGVALDLLMRQDSDWKAAAWLLSGPLAYGLYATLIFPMLQRPPQARRLQALAVNFCWLYLLVALLWNCFSSTRFPLLLSLLLVFWLWERWVMFLLDHRRGRVPKNLKLSDFLGAFLSPALLVNMGYLNRIGKGYAYMQESYRPEERERVVRAGLELLAWSLLFLLLRPWMLAAVQALFQAAGAGVYHGIEGLMKGMARGARPSTASVWSALVFDFLNFYLIWTVIAHLKVAFWRLCGYHIEPYFQSPFLATNLVSLWRRYSYYYCEFLVAAFYYPAFMKLRQTPRPLRVFIATGAAAGLGNFLWHLLEGLLLSGPTPLVFATLLRTVPFFLLFGTAVGLTSVYLTSVPRRRQPWTGPAQLLLRDVVAVVATFGVYIWLRFFRHASAHSFESCLEIGLRALGW